MKTILDFYIRSSLHVAVCFVALAMVYTVNTYSTSESLRFNLLQFCLVICAYNFIKYFSLIIKGKPFKYKTGIIGVSIVAGIGSLILLIPEFSFIYAFILSAIILVVLYTLPLILGKNLRSFTILKLPIIALCWAILTAAFLSGSYLEVLRENVPLGLTICFGNLHSFLKMDISILYLWTSLFFFVQALCIPFEIRDIKYDQRITDNLAKVLGVFKIKLLGYLFLVFSFLFLNLYWNWSMFLVTPYGLIEIIVFAITALSIYFSDKVKSDYYASFFVEAIPVLWLGLYWVL